MHPFLIAIICLTGFAAAQSVLVVTSPSQDTAPTTAIAASEVVLPEVAGARVLLGEDLPEPATMMLLVAGLSGLTAAGSRNRDRKKRFTA